MVKQFGMSRLGRIYYPGQDPPAWLATPSAAADQSYSEHTARAIDKEIRFILDLAAAEVRQLLGERRTAREALARRLLEQEVIDAGELHDLVTQFAPAHEHHSGAQGRGSLTPGDDGVNLRS